MPNQFFVGAAKLDGATCDPDSFLPSASACEARRGKFLCWSPVCAGDPEIQPPSSLLFCCFFSFRLPGCWILVSTLSPCCVTLPSPLSLPSSLANRAASSEEPSPGESAGLVPCKQRRAWGGRWWWWRSRLSWPRPQRSRGGRWSAVR